MDPEIPRPVTRRSFCQRWLVDPIIKQLTQGVSPEKIALSVSVGSTLALFPILGTTTTLCVIAGVVLGLNQPIIQAVNALCTFAYFPLIVAFVRFGDRLAGSVPSSLDLPLMMSLIRHHPGEFFSRFGVTALHAALGWAVVAPFWVPLAYVSCLYPLRAAARRIGHRKDITPGAG